MPTRVLQEGFGRLVVLEDGEDVVRKTFHDGPAALRHEMARSEFDRLRHFSAALEDVPGAACPRPLELLAEPAPGLRMERAPGVRLFEFLALHRLPPERREQLAGTIAAAVRAYVGTLGEPYLDLNFDNVLYDAPSGSLTFVDLGPPQGMTPPDPSWSDYEVTVGNLLGSVVFQSGRPRYILHRRRHGDAGELAAAVVRSLASAVDGQLRPAALLGAARAAYVRCAFGRAAARSAWYGTVGYAFCRRVRLPQATFGPVAPWRLGA
jgi:hypothetical protein